MEFYDGRKQPITAKKALQNARKRLRVYIEESGNIYTLTLKKVLEYGIPRECLIIEAVEREPYASTLNNSGRSARPRHGRRQR